VELAERLNTPLNTVSYHVRLLHEVGFIELVDETRVRGAVEHHYRAKERPTISEEAWASASPAAKQAVVGAALQTVDDYIRASAAAGGFDRAEAQLTRTILHLDAKGWEQLTRAAKRLVEQVERIQEAATKRLERNPRAGDAIDVGFALMVFEAVRLSERATERAT
jgi:hypothetical protein